MSQKSADRAFRGLRGDASFFPGTNSSRKKDECFLSTSIFKDEGKGGGAEQGRSEGAED